MARSETEFDQKRSLHVLFVYFLKFLLYIGRAFSYFLGPIDTPRVVFKGLMVNEDSFDEYIFYLILQ